MVNAGCQSGPQLNCGLKPCGLGWFGLPYNMVTKLQEQACRRGNVHGLLPSLGSHRASLPLLVKAATEFCPRSIGCRGHRLHHGMGGMSRSPGKKSMWNGRFCCDHPWERQSDTMLYQETLPSIFTHSYKPILYL